YYSNLTTARTSQDMFGRNRWNDFLYASAFAGALGVWPFTDVLMSKNRNDLLIATLSAGPVGIGDGLGNVVENNLLKSVRPDGVIVKPDVPLTPTDDTFIADAQGIDVPMVASTWSDLGNGVRAIYLFAYARGANMSFAVTPASFGITSAAWLYRDSSASG